MSRQRFANLEPERQESILAAAADEFAERGYVGASLTRIIEAAGISKGSLYYYFNDKADLFATAVREATERVFRDVGGLPLDELSASSYWDSLRDIGLRSTELMSQDAWYIRLALAYSRLRAEPETGEALRPTLEWGRRLTERLLERGRELGAVRRDAPLALLVELTMALDETGDRWMMEHRDELDAAAFARLVEVRIDLLRDMLDAKHEGWER